MRFAYADPPYLGLAAKFLPHLHPHAGDSAAMRETRKRMLVAVVRQWEAVEEMRRQGVTLAELGCFAQVFR